jgi:hypothetical protein
MSTAANQSAGLVEEGFKERDGEMIYSLDTLDNPSSKDVIIPEFSGSIVFNPGTRLRRITVNPINELGNLYLGGVTANEFCSQKYAVFTGDIMASEGRFDKFVFMRGTKVFGQINVSGSKINLLDLEGLVTDERPVINLSNADIDELRLPQGTNYKVVANDRTVIRSIFGEKEIIERILRYGQIKSSTPEEIAKAATLSDSSFRSSKAYCPFEE